MKDYFGRKLGHAGFELCIIADVGANIVYNGPDGSQGEHVGFGAGVEGVASNLRAQPAQPEREPTPFETRVTGQKNAPSAPVLHHLFQSTLPRRPQLFASPLIYESNDFAESAMPQRHHKLSAEQTGPAAT